MYIQLISLHGLIRGANVEMGRDADTGGQVRYVLELATNLAKMPGIDGVDLFTRRIKDKRVSKDYSEPIEELAPNCRLVRLPCGPGRYLRKEKLWPYVDEFVDAMITFTRKEGKTPALVHGHYADAGYIAKEVASVFDVPFVFTGHSLGKPKLEYLTSEGWTREEVDKELAMEHRIQVEQDCLSVADLVITSTRHERDQQYAGYFKEEDLNFKVIPPGTDLERFFPYYDYELSSNSIDEQFKQARMRMTRELGRFHFASDRPLILALCRPDRRKNINALIRAYGESKELQAIANLAVFAGIREDIESMSENEQKVLNDMLLAMDRYDLYGKMAIPKNHSSEFDVPELYRLAASSRGIFVNSAFIELFGLTSIESSATGLPFVATKEGGPQDIAENCKSGYAVDVTDSKALTGAMLKLLTDHEQWDEFSANGVNLVRELYSWETHCEHYMEAIQEIVSAPSRTPSAVGKPAVGPRMVNVERLLITDIDNTLLGDDEALAELKQVLKDNKSRIGFGVASGRALELVDDVLEKHGIHDIDVIISSVGAEIYYGPDRQPVKGWGAHLRSRWKPERVHAALDGLPFLHLQPESHAQREFKISYSLDDSLPPKEALPLIRDALSQTGVAHSLIFSHGRFLDILPHRASKGKAIRYLSSKWNIPLTNIATAGDSGNDLDMLTGETAGIVVGNYDPELEKLKESKSSRVYFAEAHCAGGILEGLEHYGFIGSPRAHLRAVGA